VVEQRRLPFLTHYHEGPTNRLERIADWLEQKHAGQDWILSGRRTGRSFTYKAHRNFSSPRRGTSTKDIGLDIFSLPAIVG